MKYITNLFTSPKQPSRFFSYYFVTSVIIIKFYSITKIYLVNMFASPSIFFIIYCSSLISHDIMRPPPSPYSFLEIKHINSVIFFLKLPSERVIIPGTKKRGAKCKEMLSSNTIEICGNATSQVLLSL